MLSLKCPVFIIALALIGSSLSLDCRNNGTQISTYDGNKTCVCPLYFTGKHCEIELLCPDRLCEKGGSCFTYGSYKQCICPENKAGNYCTLSVKPSTSLPVCVNGGTTVEMEENGTAEYAKSFCVCPPEYTGQFCEMKLSIGRCADVPSCNNGACVTLKDDVFGCKCNPGYQGPFCKEITNDCFSNPCGTGGTCVPQREGYKCACSAHFSGARCEIEFCAADTCKNGGCINTPHGFECSCYTFYTGRRCDTLNKCYRNPCLNGATCEDLGENYKCSCTPGFDGDRCEENKKFAVAGHPNIAKSNSNLSHKVDFFWKLLATSMGIAGVVVIVVIGVMYKKGKFSINDAPETEYSINIEEPTQRRAERWVPIIRK